MYMPQAAERRQHPRKQVSAEVYITYPDNPSPVEKAHMRDLSLGGMAITRPQFAVEPGQLINIYFVSQAQDCDASHVIEARIMRIEAECIGVAFETMGVQSLNDIHQRLRNQRFF
jgi:c-di-GMP-binding flagellar brake protein YcgR